jgi:hypothetical protein
MIVDQTAADKMTVFIMTVEKWLNDFGQHDSRQK